MWKLVIVAALALTGGGGSKSTVSSSNEKAPTPEVYLYGNRIAAPYAVELAGETVLINKIQAFPPLPDADARVADAPKPTVAQVTKHEFVNQGWELQRKLELEGKCCGEVAGALADYYRSRPDLVAEVRDVRGSSFWVRWVDGGEEEIITAPSGSASAKDRARAELELVKEMLDRGCILIIASSGRVTVPPDDATRSAEVRAEIARARRTPGATFGTASMKYADATWDGMYLPADIARQFARPLRLTPHQED